MFFHVICSFITLFIKTNSSWLIFESINALEIKTSTFYVIYILVTILFDRVSSSFLIIDLYFLFPAVTAQMFSLIVELKLPSKEAKVKVEMHPVTAKMKQESF